MRNVLLGCLSLCGLALACGEAPTPPPKVPEAPALAASAPVATASAAPPAEAPKVAVKPPPARKEPGYALPIVAPDMAEWERATKVKGVPPAPATCAAYATRLTTGKDCPLPRPALERALKEADPGKRDAQLAALERCPGFTVEQPWPAGFVRTLRADLAPLECADAIADAAIRKPEAGTSPLLSHTLAGLSLAARISRTPRPMPRLAPPFTKDRVLAHTQALIKDWYVEQARIVEEISLAGAKLAFYGRAIVAIEAGLAELRFIEGTRQIPVPEEWNKDPELKDAYFVTLEQALEPRKARARDAVLLGLRELASVGFVHDARVTRARATLARMYAGRRIDMLDDLILPPVTADDGALLGVLSTFYAGFLLPARDTTDPSVLSRVFQRGVPWTVRAALDQDPRRFADPVLRRQYTRVRFDLGRTHWRGADFDAVRDILHHAGDADPAARLLGALVDALSRGPDDAVQMMHAKSPGELQIRDVKALEALAKDPTVGAMAEYDAAVLLALAPPDDARAAYFQDVAARFGRAAAAFSDPALQKRAEERKKAAELVAGAAPK